MSHSRPGSRASQRPASRSSFRAASPAPDDAAVGLRTQISTVKHEIRQQTARLQSLENALQRAPRPIPNLSPTSPENPLRRRSSLNDAAIAANGAYDSLIPVPSRNRNSNTHHQGIKEGVPLESLQTDLATGRRAGSPTRSISRIPVASVGHARTLAEEGAASPSDTSGLLDPLLLQAPPSPGATSSSGRRSVGGGGGNTTRVLADLQAGVLSARSALENTKGQLRQSQRTVAQLTRQTEDLKEGRERLRIEIEGLNNVVARKERLLQEVLERARKAEAEATALKAQLKTETASTKRSLRDMEAALSEATALSQKSASEYGALQASFARLGDGWRRELDGVRAEMRAREETLRKEADEIGVKYRALVKLVQASAGERARLDAARKEAAAVENAFADEFRGELQRLADEVERSSAQSNEDSRMTVVVKDELARILRLMQALGRASVSDDEDTTLDL